MRIAILSIRKIKGRISAAAACMLLIFAIPYLERRTAPPGLPTPEPGQAALYVFDVGQGDAILAQEGNGQILIDGGPDASILEHLGKAMPRDDRTIELMILTHPHSDHLDGLIAVLERYEVAKIMASGVPAPTEEYRRWQEIIASRGIPVDDPLRTRREEVGGMIFDVLHSGTWSDVLRGKRDGNSDGLNDASIVGSLRFGAVRFLLMGDVTSAVEDRSSPPGRESGPISSRSGITAARIRPERISSPPFRPLMPPYR
jgi:beta-lactamase superfamily II metal-dependent hydrolase